MRKRPHRTAVQNPAKPEREPTGWKPYWISSPPVICPKTARITAFAAPRRIGYRYRTARGVNRMREFQRGAVRLHILHHAAEQEIHGAWMTEELARHGYDISPGTLYPTLHRLEADGLLVSEQQVVEGRTRRVYRATEAGKRALAADRRALKELAREVLGGDAST